MKDTNLLQIMLIFIQKAISKRFLTYCSLLLCAIYAAFNLPTTPTIAVHKTTVKDQYERYPNFELKSNNVEDAAKWQNYALVTDTNTSASLRLWKAHYDTRMKGYPTLQILVNYVGHNAFNTTSWKNGYCVAWFKKDPKKCIKYTAKKSSSIPIRNFPGNLSIMPLLISCSDKSLKSQPIEVSLTKACNEIATNNKLKINYPRKPAVEHQFGICAPVLYDNLSNKEAIAIVEWIEFYKMMGVSGFHFHVINLRIEPLVQRVLEYYKGLNQVTMEKIVLPIELPSNTSGYQSKVLVLNNALADCFLQYHNLYKFIAIVDLDDVIVPKKNASIFQDIFNLSSNTNIYSTFSHDYFIDFGPQYNFSLPLILSKYVKTTEKGQLHKKGNKYKPVIRSKACLVPWQHGCVISTRGTRLHGKTIATDVAISHHYRRSCADGYIPNGNGTKFRHEFHDNLCAKYLNGTSNDTSAFQYTRHLLPRVLKVIEDLKLNSSEFY